MKHRLILTLLLPLFIFSQEFADKNYYLIDSLILNELEDHDRKLIDSCLNEYHLTQSDTTKANYIITIIENCDNDFVWPKYNIWLSKLCERKLKASDHSLFYKKIFIGTLNNFGFNYKIHGKIEEALYSYNKSIKISNQINDLQSKAISLNNIGDLYDEQGNIEKALSYYHQSLKISEETNDKESIALTLNNIGLIYDNLGELERALNYYQEVLKIDTELNNLDGIATTLGNMGVIYHNLGNTEKALDYYNKALKINEKLKNKSGTSISLNNIGSIYDDQGDFKKALEFYHQALEIDEKLENKNRVIIYLNNIGDLNNEIGELKKAREYLLKSFHLSIELGYPYEISKSANILSNIALKEQNYKEAYEMYALHIKMRDSINNIDTQKAAIEQEAKYNYEKQKNLDDLKSQKKLELESEKNKRQLIVTLLVASILLIVIIFLVIIYKRLQLSKKQKIIIEQQKIEVEEANKEVNDSINYGELIQTAVLPTLSIKDLLNESFIYFNPKDRVSGDFYWLEQKENYSGYCVADCTGHGIPGAFISMIGTILLNEIYNSKKIDVPNEILDELSRLVRLTLTNKEGYTMKDGMDISFVALNNTTKVLYFSGANNPVWIASKNQKKRINKIETEPIIEFEGKFLYEIKGDKQPIGEYGENIKPFTLNSAHLEKGDVFYLFTDGYADQFGGGNNKKFKTKPFKHLLLSVFEKTLEEQNLILDQKFQQWKGTQEQIDDVTVMGVRI